MPLTFHNAPATADAVARVTQLFATTFGREPDSVASAPGRVNIIGEHIDYSGGSCLPMALPHRTFVALGLRSDGVIRLTSDARDDVWEGSLDTFSRGVVSHWSAYVGGVLVWLNKLLELTATGCDIAVVSSVPIGAGLSSSAALECATAFAYLDAVGVLDRTETQLRQIARAAISAENTVAGANTGGMDQFASLFGRDGALLHLQCTDFSFAHVPFSLSNHGLLVIDTRASHSLSDGQYGDRRTLSDAAARALGVDHLSRASLAAVDTLPTELQPIARHAITENERVTGVVEHIEHGDFTAAGAALLRSHESLRDDYRVSCPELDVVVDSAMEAGALGARMTGGGFGGSAIALIATDEREQVAAHIAAAAQSAGFAEPHFLTAVPSGGAAIH